jgi:AraC-like DNA-binding protein
MAELTVAAGLARGLLALAVAKGANQAELAARASISVEDLEDQDNRIPLSKYIALTRGGAKLCNDPALALHYGETIDLSEISVVGMIGRAAETMLDAMAQINRFGRLVIEVDVGTQDRFQLDHKDNELWLVDTRPNPNDFPELTEATFARMVCNSRQFGTATMLKAIHVTHPRPPHSAEYDRIFGVPITFESQRNAMQIAQSWLTVKVALAPRYVFGILSEHADALLKSLENSKTTRGHIESLLIPVLHTGDISMEMIATKMRVSRQTLFRKLKAEGTTFEKLLDELRHKLALHYLNGKHVSVNETAYLVGFSEAAAFSRAFKRWTGLSPSAMRKSPP